MSDFPVTRHSVIEQMRSADPEARRHAFGDLVEGYWKALQRYLGMQWHLPPDEAEEVTQAFLAEAFQKAWLARHDPQKARFRTFIRVCADRFVLNRQQAARRIKRGGDVEMLSLDGATLEEELVRQRAAHPDADELFRREFVRALFERTVDDVRNEFIAAGKRLHVDLFERYDLDPADGVSYALLAQSCGLTPSQVTNHLAQVRRRFRERALETLRSLCGTDEEFRREASEIFGVTPQ
jgi:DNA-directed RNA polymerase specialized sigma24 family protein